MKKIVLGLIVLSSIGFCYENWKSELSIYKGLLNTFSSETSKYFCEAENKELIINDILEHFKKQDEEYYKSNKKTIDEVPKMLIKSTEREEQSCPDGFIVTGSCGEWICVEKIEK